MANPREYVCKYRGCAYANSDRKFDARGIVGHYRRSHNDTAEGQRQFRLQKAALRRTLAASLGEPDPENQMADLQADGSAADHVADELLPGTEGQETLIHEVNGVNVVGNVVVSEGTEQFLDNRISRLRSEAGILQSQLATLELEMGIIADELTRTLAAKAAWDAAVKPKVRTAGEADPNNPSDVEG